MKIRFPVLLLASCFKVGYAKLRIASVVQQNITIPVSTTLMRMHQKKIIVLVITALACKTVVAQTIVPSTRDVIVSAIKGLASKPDTIWLSSSHSTVLGKARVKGDDAAFFSVTASAEKISAGNSVAVVVIFEPSKEFTGIARAELVIRGCAPIRLTGLSTKGLEGENEATLASIVDALGYKINVGWTTLANHLRPEQQGEELAPALFQKASSGNVELIPVARYSPDFPLNVGYYTISKTGPVQHQTAVLSKAGNFPEHQTLYPTIWKGQTSFDPGDASFGFYAISPGHTLYSEDIWNILFHPAHATHAMRIYPMHTKQNTLVENTFLVSMEEAANGDFNDYVFIVRNVNPVFLQSAFTPLMNDNNLRGWHTWLKDFGENNDPHQVFTLEGGILHDLGKDLGYIITEKKFGNYHFTLEFKWGDKKWPPRQNSKRDSGICYNIPDTEPDGIWPVSVECQIQEGDVGDFWMLGNSTIQVDGKQNPPLDHAQIVKKKDGEKTIGEWNTVEVISFNGKCAHIVNGVLVNYGENASVVGGKILLQSEYAEIYYRNIRIREFE